MVRERIKGDVVLFMVYNRCKFLAAKNVMEYLGKNVSGMSLFFSGSQISQLHLKNLQKVLF